MGVNGWVGGVVDTCILGDGWEMEMGMHMTEGFGTIYGPGPPPLLLQLLLPLLLPLLLVPLLYYLNT
jgi:hypothetical protein